jgi:hypothetical protein
MNGSFEETSPSYDNSPAQTGQTPPYSSSLKSPNANSAINTPVSGGNENVSYKETPSPIPAPTAAVPKTQAAPWLAELRKKQDKKLTVGGTPSSTSPVQAQQPQLKDKDKDRTDSNLDRTPPTAVTSTPQPQPPVSAARHVAPPLPAKPTLPQMSPAGSTYDRQSPTSPSTHAPPSLTVAATTQSNSSTPATIVSSATNVLTNNNLSNVASKFGGQKRTVTAINHTNSAGDTTHHTSGPGNGSSGNQDWVPYEEHAKLKEKVAKLELELEYVKKQLKLFLDNKSYTNSTGHIV